MATPPVSFLPDRVIDLGEERVKCPGCPHQARKFWKQPRITKAGGLYLCRECTTDIEQHYQGNNGDTTQCCGQCGLENDEYEGWFICSNAHCYHKGFCADCKAEHVPPFRFGHDGHCYCYSCAQRESEEEDAVMEEEGEVHVSRSVSLCLVTAWLVLCLTHSHLFPRAGFRER